MDSNKEKTRNDKKEEKDNIDKGPLKEEHVNQYGEKNDNSKKKRGA